MNRRVQAHSRRRARRGPALRRAGLFLALALAFTALLAEHPASAQTASTLISNTGVSGSINDSFDSSLRRIYRVGQGFETGDNSGGYAVHAVAIPMAPTASDPVDLSLWNADTNGVPTSRHTADFARPPNFAGNQNVVFTAPAGTTLDASSNYVVVIRMAADSRFYPTTNASDAEDAGGANGWSIDNNYVTSSDDRPWRTEGFLGRSLRIDIKGQAVNALVGNLGVTPESGRTVGSVQSASQVFQSGGNYTLTSIEVDSVDPEGDDFAVSLWSVQSGLPHEKRADLVAPDSFAAGTLVFTAPPRHQDKRPAGPVRCRG